MKQKLFLLVALFSMSLIFSCGKSDSGPSSPATVSFNAVTEKLYNGSVVTLNGNNFGTDTSKVNLELDNRKMVITAMTNTSLTFTIPQDLVPSGQKDCTLEITVEGLRGQEGLSGFQRQVMVYYLEPHGWFYAGTLQNSSGTGSQIFTNLIFPTDSIGYALKYRVVYRTTDGGISWKGDGGSAAMGRAIASSDGKYAWMEFVGDLAVATDGTTWYIGRDGASYSSIIIGLYTTAPANALVATINGRLYDVNGSYPGTMKYQSSFYTTGNNDLWQKMSVLDKNNLIIAGYSQNVVLEKAGVFSEVDLSSVSSSATVKGLQQVDANTALLVNGNDELIKYAGNTWTKLAQKANAVYFTDANTGYVAYSNKIIKTTNGGANWTEVFTLKATEKVDVITVKNGKIWVVGNNDTKGFVLKYNP